MIFQYLALVFIDEISMVGADKLQRVHESLSNMSYKNKGMPFGGVSLICFGDLKQVSVPIKNAHVKKYSFSFLL